MSRPSLRTVIALAALVFAAASAPAQEALRVGTKESPPFAFRDDGETWTGISLDLWTAVAEELGVSWELVPHATTGALLDAVEAGEVDLGVAAVTVTAQREERLDFSHPYFTTGLGVAVRGEGGTGLRAILAGLISWEFLTLFGSVLLALVLSGYLFWFFERKANPQFSEGHRHGLANGIWWSIIMLFGHKGVFPKSLAGRVMAATSMLISILLLSVLTGAIASALTVGHFETLIRDVEDLRHVRTLTVAGSSSAESLRRRRIPHDTVADVRAGLAAVADGRADAFVHDAPLLEYRLAEKNVEVLRILPQTFEPQDYAFVLPQGSPLRERLNTAILQVRSSPRWPEIRFTYLQR